MSDKPPFTLSPAITCLDMFRLDEELNALEHHGAVELTFPIGDGDVAPLVSGLDMGRQISGRTAIPCHALVLTNHPERHIDACADVGYASMTILHEAAAHHHRILTRIRETGMAAGIAVNPTSSLVALEYLLDKADRVCLLGVEPGSAQGACALPVLTDRVRVLSENIRYRELLTQIMVYGGLDIATAGKALAAGASIIAPEPVMLQETGERNFAAAIKKCADRLCDAIPAG